MKIIRIVAPIALATALALGPAGCSKNDIPLADVPQIDPGPPVGEPMPKELPSDMISE